jgi:hypothetical protein
MIHLQRIEALSILEQRTAKADDRMLELVAQLASAKLRIRQLEVSMREYECIYVYMRVYTCI